MLGAIPAPPPVCSAPGDSSGRPPAGIPGGRGDPCRAELPASGLPTCEAEVAAGGAARSARFEIDDAVESPVERVLGAGRPGNEAYSPRQAFPGRCPSGPGKLTVGYAAAGRLETAAGPAPAPRRPAAGKAGSSAAGDGGRAGQGCLNPLPDEKALRASGGLSASVAGCQRSGFGRRAGCWKARSLRPPPDRSTPSRYEDRG